MQNDEKSESVEERVDRTKHEEGGGLITRGGRGRGISRSAFGDARDAKGITSYMRYDKPYSQVHARLRGRCRLQCIQYHVISSYNTNIHTVIRGVNYEHIV